jgi:hypothetical protein
MVGCLISVGKTLPMPLIMWYQIWQWENQLPSTLALVFARSRQ